MLTGPAYDSGRDHEAAAYLDAFSGHKVICGGTTANIVARELGREVVTELPRHGCDLPPVSRIDNVAGDRNLVCSCPPLSDYADAAE